MSDVSPVGNLITWKPTLVKNMNGHDPSRWEMSNWSNPDPFYATWQPDNISFNNGIMTITLDNSGCPSSCEGKPYASGEYRTISEDFGYGYYEVRMKPTQGSGLMSGSFFVYRGTPGQPSHDEIDIEFLGKDPSCQTLQLNYYVEGRGNHERLINLPFNACQDFHNYGFKWTPNEIIWYVDGQEVHRATEDPSTPQREIPYRPGRIVVNFWPGIGVDNWLGRFSYPGHPLQVQYDWIKYSTLEAATQQPSTESTKYKHCLGAPNPYAVNFEIGWEYFTDGRTELFEAEVAEKLPLEQLEETLENIVNYPYVPTNENEKREVFPELRKTDQKYYYKLLPFLACALEYWNNAITLLSAYLQKSIEESKEDKITKILGYVDEFRKTIKQIPEPEITDPYDYRPNWYKIAQLDLIEAEARLLTQNQNADFYKVGIERAVLALSTFINPPQKKYHPTKPDYFKFVKGILILASLYHRVGELTYEEKYLEVAGQLLESVSKVSSNGLRINLHRLFVDPFISNPDPVNLLIFDPVCETGLPEYAMVEVTPNEILEALNFNKSQGYIRTIDVERAKIGIFHYLRGLALIKAAELFVTWPRKKSAKEIEDARQKLSEGVKELHTASQEDEEKFSYFYTLAQILEGELLLALADRKLFEYQLQSLEELENFTEKEIRPVILEAEKKFLNVSPDFEDLYIWAQAKRVEIAFTRTGSVAGPKIIDPIAKIDEIKTYEEISRYLLVNLLFIKVNLLIQMKNYSDARKTLEEAEKYFPHLHPYHRPYFEFLHNIRLTEIALPKIRTSQDVQHPTFHLEEARKKLKELEKLAEILGLDLHSLKAQFYQQLTKLAKRNKTQKEVIKYANCGCYHAKRSKVLYDHNTRLNDIRKTTWIKECDEKCEPEL